VTRLRRPLVLPLGRPILAHRWLRRRRPTSSPITALLRRRAGVHWWCAAHFGGVCLAVAAAAVRTPAAHENAEDDETANAGCDSDDERLVALEPVFDFATKVAVTVALLDD
jgi:hypothetical protein